MRARASKIMQDKMFDTRRHLFCARHFLCHRSTHVSAAIAPRCTNAGSATADERLTAATTGSYFDISLLRPAAWPPPTPARSRARIDATAGYIFGDAAELPTRLFDDHAMRDNGSPRHARVFFLSHRHYIHAGQAFRYDIHSWPTPTYREANYHDG